MKRLDTSQLDPEIAGAYDEFRRVHDRVLKTFAAGAVVAGLLLVASVISSFVIGASYVGMGLALSAQATIIAMLVVHAKSRSELRGTSDTLKRLLAEARSTR